jgi:hypothetical protein
MILEPDGVVAVFGLAGDPTIDLQSARMQLDPT